MIMITMSNKCDDDEVVRKGGEDGHDGGDDGHDGGEDGHDGGDRVQQLLPQGGAAGEDPGVLDHQVQLRHLPQMLKSFMMIMMMSKTSFTRNMCLAGFRIVQIDALHLWT